MQNAVKYVFEVKLKQNCNEIEMKSKGTVLGICKLKSLEKIGVLGGEDIIPVPPLNSFSNFFKKEIIQLDYLKRKSRN